MESNVSGIGKRRARRNNVGDEFPAAKNGHLKTQKLNKTDEQDEQDESGLAVDTKTKSDQDGLGTEQEVEELRLLARERYLKDRERLKLQVLKQELALQEEDVLARGWNNFSKAERDEINLKRELVALVQDREVQSEEHGFRLQNDYVDEEGRIDSGRKKQLLQAKQAPRSEKHSRQQLWEDQQLKNAVQASGDTDEIRVDGSEDYEFVFDEEAMVEFTAEDEESAIPETQVDYNDKLIQELDREHERLQTIKDTRKSLPVYRFREPLLDAIRANQVLIVVGETGSGKTTQLPQYLVEEGFTQDGKFQIACTQPRRVAATSVATRVADEMNVILGREVGYSIRFDDKTTPDTTVLKYLTDGMLLREFMTDPELNKYACIIIDEAHERTLSTDVLLGLLKDILPHRKDLKLIISSATMNAAKFADFFYNAPIFNVPGRRFPVDIHYTLQPEANYLNAAVTTIFQIHTTQPLPGDILVFLTGQEEIEAAQQSLEEIAHVLGSKIKPLIIAPIYANLPQDQQSKIFEPTPKDCRKVVLATNIAETSLTIDGIKFVIDPGFVKENSYVPSTGMSQLLTVPCSRASVDQRAGRAGRVGPGKCFRIFTKWSYYHELELLPKPEILRTNLSQVILLLMSLGVTDLLDFPLLDKPSIPAMSKALENLYTLGALNSKGAITRLGRMMCEFPCEPEFGKVLHTAATHESCKGCLEEIITIVAMLHETASLFVHRKSDREQNKSGIVGKVSSDHMLYLETYNNWKDMNYSRSWCIDHKVQFKTLLRVRKIRDQFWRCCDNLGLIALNEQAAKAISGSDRIESRIIKSFIAGFPSNIAKLGTSGYQTMGARQGGVNVSVHPTSTVFQALRKEMAKPPKYMLYQRLVLTSKEFMRDCLPIPREDWLHEMVPHYFRIAGKLQN
ncbi:LAFA_0F14312g1_1 [Lachancea sp. 'fantastica']|nr:LAFA_0F14312g1_1 [Lachancea sp. 'fantastica']